MVKTITRDDLHDILTNWHDNLMSAKEVNDWAGERYQNDVYDFEDWEGAEENSVTNEVLSHLDMLDINLLTPDDIPAYLAFLSMPIGKFHEGFSRLERHLDSIDIESRKKTLEGVALYKPFCI